MAAWSRAFLLAMAAGASLMTQATEASAEGNGAASEAAAAPAEVDPSQTIVWGPGLNPDATMPVRYFFVQAVDQSGSNFTTSAGADAFSLQVDSIGGERVPTWRDVLDLKDGTYIVRYRLLQQHRLGLSISLLAGSGGRSKQHVTGSPFQLRGSAYQENCYCPRSDLGEAMSALQCSSYDQIGRDLSRFRKTAINMTDTVLQVEKRFNQRLAYSLAHYVVKDNKVYRKTYGEYVGFTMFSDKILLSLARKVKLPDVEFIMNLGDWPLEKNLDRPIPIFSWCGSDSTADIVLPTYDITESTLGSLSRASLDVLSVQGKAEPVWSKKTAKGFWRGRDSRQERLDLVVKARQGNNSDLLDAAMTNFFFFPYDEKLYGPKGQHVSFFDFFKYKYQINVDGTVAAYRFPYLLAGGSLVLKQDSPFYEHFYKDLEPWKHYVPLDSKLSDVLEKIKWARDHDDEAHRIAKQGQAFARDRLTPNHILCYHISLLQEFAQLLEGGSIEVRPGMQVVPQPTEESECSCLNALQISMPQSSSGAKVDQLKTEL